MSSLSVQQRRAIDQAKEILVGGAETLLKNAKVSPSKDFGHSQLRNLTAVAMETESPAVVLNFIRYQMGRDAQGRNWASVHEGKRLGDRFLAELSRPEPAAAGTTAAEVPGAVEQAFVQAGGPEAATAAQQLIRMELIRYFLGFVTRYMKFLELERPKRGGR